MAILKKLKGWRQLTAAGAFALLGLLDLLNQLDLRSLLAPVFGDKTSAALVLAAALALVFFRWITTTPMCRAEPRVGPPLPPLGPL